MSLFQTGFALSALMFAGTTQAECNWGSYGGIPLVSGECNDLSSVYIMVDCDDLTVGLYSDSSCDTLSISYDLTTYSCGNSGSCTSIDFTQSIYTSESDCSGSADAEYTFVLPELTDECVNGTSVTTSSSGVEVDYYSDIDCSGSSYASIEIESGCYGNDTTGVSIDYSFSGGKSNLQSKNIYFIGLAGAIIASLFV